MNQSEIAGYKAISRYASEAGSMEAQAEKPTETPPASARASARAQAVIRGHWGRLPENAPLSKEVDWVYGNLQRCVKFMDGKSPEVNEFKAKRKPPSEGARAMLFWAASNYNAFFTNFVLKVKIGDDGADGEMQQVERRRVEEMKRVLGKYRGTR